MSLLPASLKRQAQFKAYRLRAPVDSRRFRSALAVDAEGPAIILSPHFDDAVLDCWSVLSRGGRAEVVNVFAGIPSGPAIPSWDRICGATDIARHVRDRIREDAEALAAVGVKPVNLPFLSQDHRDGPPPLQSTLARAIASSAPTARRLYAPAMVGEPHPDHLLVRALALALCRRGVPTTLYADLPYAVAFGWPHWVTGEAKNPRLDVDVFWNRFLEPVRELAGAPPRVVELSADEAAVKLGALRKYETQFAGLDANGLFTSRSIHTFEVFWDL